MASPFLGLDMRNDPKQVRPGTVLLSQNFVPYNAQVFSKRKGTVCLCATPWTGVLRVPWATRFYMSGVCKSIAAVARVAGDQIGQVDDVTGAFTPLLGMPVVGSNQRWRGVVAGEVPALYLGNNYGADGILVTTDGVTIAPLAGTGIPAKGFLAGPYFDRLLCYSGKRVYYSRTNLFTDWTNPTTGNPQYLRVIGDEEVEAVFLPGPDRTEVGFTGKLYICTPTSTWVHQRDFDGTSGDPSSAFTKIHERAGVAGFNTLAWTDHGCVGMGVDNIWFFPIDGMPVPIGYEVEPIIRDIPSAYRSRCCATFYRGFYILSYVRPGQTAPDRELWCDMRTFQPAYAASRSGLDTPAASQGITWHGPMIRDGIGIGMFVVRTQVPDEGELDAYGASEGQVMHLETNVYTDNGIPIVSILTTGDLEVDLPAKVHEGYVYAFYAYGDDQILVYYSADEGFNSSQQTMVLQPDLSKWDISPSEWDTTVWGADYAYFSAAEHWEARPVADKIRITVTHQTAQAFDLKEIGAWMHVLGRVAV